MAITPNYSWPLPDDTDLVKDGAEAIRDLGNAIDTTVDGLPGAGLVHINTTTFSAVAAQSINDVFNATYTNYLALISVDNLSTATLNLRLRISGSDETANNYLCTLNSFLNTLTNVVNTGATTTLQISPSHNVSTLLPLYFFNPFGAANTRFSADGIQTERIKLQLAGAFGVANSYTGFSVYPSTGNITGNIQVFGVKN